MIHRQKNDEFDNGKIGKMSKMNECCEILNKIFSYKMASLRPYGNQKHYSVPF